MNNKLCAICRQETSDTIKNAYGSSQRICINCQKAISLNFIIGLFDKFRATSESAVSQPASGGVAGEQSTANKLKAEILRICDEAEEQYNLKGMSEASTYFGAIRAKLSAI